MPEPGRLQTTFGPLVLLNRDLPVDQKSQTIFKSKIAKKFEGAFLVGERLEEAGESEGQQFFFDRVDQHGASCFG